MVFRVARKPPTSTTFTAEALTRWMKRLGWPFAEIITRLSTKTVKWLVKWEPTRHALENLQSNLMNPHPSDSPPVDFKIAGAEMTCDADGFHGRFHPIQDTLWQAIIGFHRQVSINLDGESVSYHKWNEQSQDYDTIIPWQKTASGGLSVNVNWNDPRNKQLLDDFARLRGYDFFPACTIHTHVDSSAFESGTDAADERDNPGWHITLGKLVTYNRYHFHFRARLPKLRRLKEVADTDRVYVLGYNHLFVPNKAREEFLHTTPGTTDWHQFLPRVEKR